MTCNIQLPATYEEGRAKTVASYHFDVNQRMSNEDCLMAKRLSVYLMIFAVWDLVRAESVSCDKKSIAK